MSRRVPEPQMKKLLHILREIGWTMAIPIIESSGAIPGAIIGTHAFVDVMKELVAEANDESETLPLPKP